MERDKTERTKNKIIRNKNREKKNIGQIHGIRTKKNNNNKKQTNHTYNHILSENTHRKVENKNRNRKQRRMAEEKKTRDNRITNQEQT